MDNFLTNLGMMWLVLLPTLVATASHLGRQRPRLQINLKETLLTQDQINAALVAIGINPNTPLPNNPNIAAALANYKASGDAVAKALNDNATANYLDGFNNWSNNFMAGRASANSYPFPPPGYQAVQAPDGWVYVILGTDPVCAVPPLPTLPTVPAGQVNVVGVRMQGAGGAPTSYFSASTILNGVTTVSANVPAGFTFHTTSQDGITGSFQWVPSPFGGWWQQIA